ncbi:DMT family transporter [Streptomyces sp. NPDC046685]|uniref:EamA family transporter n=1 Tax=Streptomyces sp. NPDC046685 TaxID=3157202 RepID=UPI0033FBECAF
MQASGRHAGLGLALVSAFAFGGSGVAAKPLIEAGLDPLHMVWLRVAGAALVLSPLAWCHRDLVRRRPALVAGFGLVAVAGVQAFYFASLSRIPVGVALLLEYLGPALLLGYIRFVQRKPVTRGAAAGAAVAVAGLACVVEIWAGLSLDLLGVLFGLAAACCQAFYFVFADQGADGDEVPDPLGVIVYGMLVGTLVMTVIARPWEIDWQVLGGQAAMGGTMVPAPVLLGWVVLIATVFAYLTGVVSVRKLSPQVAGVVAVLEAVVATVLAWIMLGEHLSTWQIVGGGLVLGGAFIAQSSRSGPAAQATPAAPATPEATVTPEADAAGLDRETTRA